MKSPPNSSYSERVGAVEKSVEVAGQMRMLYGISNSFLSMDIMFRPAARWPAFCMSAYRIMTAEVVSLVVRIHLPPALSPTIVKFGPCRPSVSPFSVSHLRES